MNKFEIILGKQNNNKLEDRRRVGMSFYKPDKKFYKLQLNILPNVICYMKRNKNNESYTIFSGLNQKGKKNKLYHPIGRGSIANGLKTHMTLYFDVLNTSLYMSLFPAN